MRRNLLPLLLFAACAAPQATRAEGVRPWAADWAVESGFAVRIDTDGYALPTAIAFVPEPGDAPGDPLYFVTELAGAVKVVTNERTVQTFADDFFVRRVEKDFPAVEAQTGMAGLCLDPEHGYVFVTYAYTDADGRLRNGMTRFETAPGRFAAKPASRVDFADAFAADVSAPAHQIGPCQVHHGLLYVGIGDGWNHILSRSLDSTVGKVLRMTLDGEPAPGNPFARGDDGAADYVWAYGLRNPFGLEVVDGRLFVADNGPAVDRFVEVRRGEDYLWNGHDWSITARADFAFSPAVSPVQMEFHDGDPGVFPPAYQDRFYITLSGDPRRPGPAVRGERSIVALRYDFERGRVAAMPDTFLRYRGSGNQALVGLGFGPDGLYFVPLLPDAAGRSAVLKVVHDPERPHPFTLGVDDPPGLIARYGCLGCHSLDAVGNTAAPALDRAALVQSVSSRLKSGTYRALLRELEETGYEPLRTSADSVDRILEMDGAAQVRAWVALHIERPGFDNPASQMPSLGVSRAEAVALASHLAPEGSGARQITERVKRWVMDTIGRPRYRHLLLSFGAGAGIGVVLTLATGAIAAFLRRRTRRDRGDGPPAASAA